MAVKFLILVALAASVRASSITAPLPYPAAIAEPYDHNPQYSYGYEVQDPLTGDSHGQVETRSGDVVKGSYALQDSDGTRRVVDYIADPVNGFKAAVSKQPVGRLIVNAPAYVGMSAPALHSASLAAAPIVRNVAPSPIVSNVFDSTGPLVTRLAAPVPSIQAAAPWAAANVRGVAPWAARVW